MNEVKINQAPLNQAQKLGVGFVTAFFIAWFSASMEWKYSVAGMVLYAGLLAAFAWLLYFLDRKAWEHLPKKTFFFSLLAAWLALFQFFGNSILGYVHTHSLLFWMYDGYNSANPGNDSSFCDFIPFLVLGLFWWKRRELLAAPLAAWNGGFFFIVCGIFLHILGYDLQQPRFSIMAMFAGIYGIMGLAWGRAWLKKSFFPFFLFFFLVPFDTIIEPVTFRLRLLVSTLVEWIAHYIFGIGVMRNGTELFDPLGSYQYDVAAACSGIHSLVAIFLLATIYGFLTFHLSWQRLLIVTLAFPFAVLGNLLRMFFIIIAADFWGQEAGNFVHENVVISLIPYVPAIFGLLWVGGWMERNRSKEKKASS
jgi:exosortase